MAHGSDAGRFVAFPLDEINELPKGKGVKLISLDKDAKACGLLIFSGDKLVLNLAVRGKNFKLVLDGDELEKHRGHRAAKGVYLPKKGVVSGKFEA